MFKQNQLKGKQEICSHHKRVNKAWLSTVCTWEGKCKKCSSKSNLWSISLAVGTHWKASDQWLFCFPPFPLAKWQQHTHTTTHEFGAAFFRSHLLFPTTFLSSLCWSFSFLLPHPLFIFASGPSKASSSFSSFTTHPKDPTEEEEKSLFQGSTLSLPLSITH